MKTFQRPGVALLFLFACLGAVQYGLGDASPTKVLTGQSAFVSSVTVKAGLFRKVTVDSLPKPFATESVTTKSRIVPRPEGVLPQAPPGFKVGLFATGLTEPRVIRVAPNGDIFVVETRAGRIRVFRGVNADGKPEKNSVFASGFHEPYGMVFYPAGKSPKWLYVANTDSVVRYAYANGDLKATGDDHRGAPVEPTARLGCGACLRSRRCLGKNTAGSWPLDARSCILAGWQEAVCRSGISLES